MASSEDGEGISLVNGAARQRRAIRWDRVCPCLVLWTLLTLWAVALVALKQGWGESGGGGGGSGDGDGYHGHTDRPNVVLIYLDDVGYGDLPANGHPTTKTPHIDALIRESISFTQAVSENSVCTPSRAALMTGRHAVRMGLGDDTLRCLMSPLTPGGLLEGEMTVADMLREKKGYATGFIGKWHLGINKNTSTDAHFMPTNRGFDYYYGMPVSHGPPCKAHDPNPLFCFVYEDDEIIKQPPDMLAMNRDSAERALLFMEGAIAAEKPFFAVMAFQKVHTPLFPSAGYQNTTRRGTFGDELAELDAGVGRLMAFLEAKKMDENTIVVLTSDNGPFLEEEIDGGSAGLFRGGKGQTWEGGFRVPLTWRWRGRIAEGVRSQNFATTMDLLPTLADILNVTLPQDRMYDGKSIAPLLFASAETKAKPRQFAYFCGERLIAVRTGVYKVHFWTQRWLDETRQSCPAYGPIGACGCTDAMLEKQEPPLVYHLEHDPSERHPLSPFVDGDDSDGSDGSYSSGSRGSDDGGDGGERLIAPDYAEAVATALLYSRRVEDSIEPVENQLRLPSNPNIQPCCNPPDCFC